jgi:2,3-bisphosphoglycerate-independent phosphoglycerate mutase
MRTILVVLDGLGDKGMKALGGKTPLQAAHTPNMDAITTMGCAGLYHSTLQGIAMPSEMAHFIMFGYDLDDFPGRGYLEAVGKGLPLSKEDVAFLARVFHVENVQEEYVLRNENVRVGIEEFGELCSQVSPYRSNGLELSLHPTGGNGGIAVVHGGASAEVTDSNPIHESRPIMAVQPFRRTEESGMARRTADFLNEYTLMSHEILSRHSINIDRMKKGEFPLNMVTFQRPGKFRQLPAFSEVWGLKSLCIASGAIYHGLCGTLGMDVEKEEDTGDCGNDLLLRLQKAYRAKEYDFVYVHTKAPDQAAHEGDPWKKKSVIESLDGAFEWVLEEVLRDEEIVFVLTSDHSTASSGNMIHSGESVPLVMAGKYARKDAVRGFDETRCAAGGLGMMRGHEIMYMILNLMDRGKLQGLMDSPENQPYVPGPFKSLRTHR